MTIDEIPEPLVDGDQNPDCTPDASSPRRRRPSLQRRKLKLELLKLHVEISDLRRPWWKRPVYWAAIIPAVAAIVAVAIGSTKDYFTTQLQLVTLQREKIDKEKGELQTNQKAAERTRTALAIQNEQLEAQKQSNEAQSAQLVAQRISNDEVARSLESRRVELEERQRQLAEAEDALRREAELAPITVQLDMMEEATNFDRPNSDAAHKLVGLLKDKQKGQAAKDEILNRLKRKTLPPGVKWALWHVLYSGTGDPTWKRKIFSAMRDKNAELPDEFFHMFRYRFSQRDADRREAFEELVRYANRHPKSIDARSRAVSFVQDIEFTYDYSFGPSRQRAFGNPEFYFDAIVLARDQALTTSAALRRYDAAPEDEKPREIDRQNAHYLVINALRALALLSPMAYETTLARIMSSGRLPEPTQSEVAEEHAGRIKRNRFSPPRPQLPESPSFPRIDAQREAWTDWLTVNSAAVAVWSEDTLATVRKNPLADGADPQ